MKWCHTSGVCVGGQCKVAGSDKCEQTLGRHRVENQCSHRMEGGPCILFFFIRAPHGLQTAAGASRAPQPKLRIPWGQWHLPMPAC